MSWDSVAVERLARKVEELVSQGNRELALQYAMEAVVPFLESPSDELRFALRNRIFNKFKGYQQNDFESVDYAQFEVSKRLPLFRGPKPSKQALATGEYFCVIGAAQTFGRLVKEPWPILLSKSIGLPVLNLSRGGNGPNFLLNREVRRLAQRSRFVVLQMLSGRSIGCSEYPGGGKTIVNSEKVARRSVLENLWREQPEKAVEYVLRWNDSYLKAYRQARSSIRRPTMLLWLSARQPAAWEPENLLQELHWGTFPQLVGPKLYRRVSRLFPKRLKHVANNIGERPLSRVTGMPCPYFGTDESGKVLHSEFNYYPSSGCHLEVAQRIDSWAKWAGDVTENRRSPATKSRHVLRVRSGDRNGGDTRMPITPSAKHGADMQPRIARANH